MLKLIEDLWFIPRHLVSEGYDQALEHISKIIPLKIHEIKTGSKCWTWIVPKKWNVSEAWIEDLDGKRYLDLKDHPLHVMSYSLPIDRIVTKEELLSHLHTRPDRPGAIPFEFKFYQMDWGFCIPHFRLKEFTKDKYKVFINSKLEEGSLKVGEYTIPGKSEEIIVLVAHLDHPHMVNDDLAGVAVLVDVGKELSKKNNYYTYKILILPETIGSIAYLSRNEELIKKIKFGIFFEMLGNNNMLSLQLSKEGNTRIDRIAQHVFKRKFSMFKVGPFRTIVSNDEMVFNGPGVDIPMISISRYPYPEYHTSDDTPNIISEKNLQESKETILTILDILDRNYIPKRKFKGPIFLSGYGLWVDWRIDFKLNKNIEKIMLNLEGTKSIFEISEELEMDFDVVFDYVNKFAEKDLVEKLH